MCSPIAITSAISLVSSVAATASQISIQKADYDYKKEVALNNYKANIEESKRQAQLGIEQARQERLQGLKEAQKLIAKNGASNFDVSSATISENYQDIIDTAYSSAKSISDEYDYNASKYRNQANLYINQVSKDTSNYNSNLFKNAITSLGSSKQVKSSWYANS